MSLFENRGTAIPTRFMRQAGRYHAHYQAIRKNHSFMDLCKNPNLAAQVTLGPIIDFNFDAAILFSDLLFPLEQLSLGLSYETGKPTLEKKISTLQTIKELKLIDNATNFYSFQKESLTLIRKELPKNKDLIGFVGAPFTLFAYACEGSHAGNLLDAKLGLIDGRYQAFAEMLLPELLINMKVQAEAKIDAIAIFDTAVGEIPIDLFKEQILPHLHSLTKNFKKDFPNTKIIYYAKGITLEHLLMIEDKNIDVLGIDWRIDLIKALNLLGTDYYIQGNFDPALLFLPWKELEQYISDRWENIQKNNSLLTTKWIASLGHGILPGTPEINVKKTVEFIHKNFRN